MSDGRKPRLADGTNVWAAQHPRKQSTSGVQARRCAGWCSGSDSLGGLTQLQAPGWFVDVSSISHTQDLIHMDALWLFLLHHHRLPP